MGTNDKSILTTTKKALGLADDYTAFDDEIILHINSVFGTLWQLGVGPPAGFEIEDKTQKWTDFLNSDLTLSPIKSYMYLRVRMLWDPPTVGYVITAWKEQIEQLEVRINLAREDALLGLGADSFTTPTPIRQVDLELTSGLPYSRVVRVTGGTSIWPTLGDFEVRSQIRSGPSEDSTLLGSLMPYITPSIDGLDILVTIDMTGAETYNVPTGYYDIVLSDIGTTDVRAIPVLSGKVKVGSLTTAASDG